MGSIVFTFLAKTRASGTCAEDLHSQPAARLERENGVVWCLLHGADYCAVSADHELARTDDARALALVELSVNRDVARADDLTALEHSCLAHDELGPDAERDRAVL